MITITLPSGVEMDAYLALPPDARDKAVPAVIVLHEIFGLNADICRIADRFAAGGYAALAPNIYAGQGPRPICIARTFFALSRRQGPAFDAIEAARRWLVERSEVDGSRLAVAGFCMGGGFALLFAARAPVGAAACFYGDVPKTKEDLAGICPVVAGYGGRDLLFRAAGKRLERLLTELDVDHDVKIYPDAGHSYMNRHESVAAPMRWFGAVSPMRVGYDDAAAEDSWRRMLAFFARHLGAQDAARRTA